jgi:rubrerythrin
MLGYLHYNPNKKPNIIISEEVKSRLQELKTKHHLKSFSEVIEMIVNDRDKEKLKQQLPSINPPQNLFCPECGHKVEGKPRFCRMCGNKL